MKRTLYKIYTRELNSVKIVDDGLDFYFHSSFFIFILFFILFYCSIFRTTQVSVKIVNDGLGSYFSLFILFYFIFLFLFLFLERLRLGFISHAVTSVTNWWHSHKTDHGTWEKEVEGSGTKWHHAAWTTHADLISYSWSFRVGCTVASTDHGW